MSKVYYLPQQRTLSYKAPSSFTSQAAEFLLIKANFDNSWVPHPRFEPRPSAEQANVLTLDHSAAYYSEAKTLSV